MKSLASGKTEKYEWILLSSVEEDGIVNLVNDFVCRGWEKLGKIIFSDVYCYQMIIKKNRLKPRQISTQPVKICWF